MSDGITEAYRKTVITKKINKHVSVDIDLRSEAIRISNSIDDLNEVEVKIGTLKKILKIVNETMKSKE